MSDIFFKTRMGLRFYDHTMPQIADELARLNTTLERCAKALLSVCGAPVSPVPELGLGAPPAGAAVQAAHDAAPGAPAGDREPVCILEDIAAGYARVATGAAPEAARTMAGAELEAALRAAFRMGVAAGRLLPHQAAHASGLDASAATR